MLQQVCVFPGDATGPEKPRPWLLGFNQGRGPARADPTNLLWTRSHQQMLPRVLIQAGPAQLQNVTQPVLPVWGFQFPSLTKVRAA